MLRIVFALALAASAAVAGLGIDATPANACAPNQVQVTSGQGYLVTSGHGFPVCANIS